MRGICHLVARIIECWVLASRQYRSVWEAALMLACAVDHVHTRQVFLLLPLDVDEVTQASNNDQFDRTHFLRRRNWPFLLRGGVRFFLVMVLSLVCQ